MTQYNTDDTAARLREKIRLQALELLDKADKHEQRKSGGFGSSTIGTPLSSRATSRASSYIDVTKIDFHDINNHNNSASNHDDDDHNDEPNTDYRHDVDDLNQSANKTPLRQQSMNTITTSTSTTPSSSLASMTSTNTNSNNIELTKRLQKLALERQLGDRKQSLKIIQSDTSSHLSSVSTFEELQLPEHLLKAIYEMGFDRPSYIQETTLPRIVSNPPRNIIGQAQSGSGKTAAFTIGMLVRTVVNNPPTLQALCVTPTRELAIQIVDKAITPMSVHMKGLKVQLAISQATLTPSQQGPPSRSSFSSGSALDAHIVVGTPGKIVDWMKRKIIRTNDIKVFVLDEADHMFEEGGHRANSLLIKKQLPITCQHLLFSATFPADVLQFATKIMNPNSATTNNNTSSLQIQAALPIIDKILIDDEGKPEALVLDVIKQLWVDTRTYHNGNKLEFLADIYSLLTIGQSIVFVSTKDEADMVYETLSLSGYTCSVLHSRVEPADRDRTMEEFRNGQSNVLITTNVLARGVDVDNVCLVINYDPPVDRDGTTPDYETYLHRIGRTGRFGRKGTAITFVNNDIQHNALRQIEQYFTGNGTNKKNMITQVNADPEALADVIEI